MEHPRLRTAGAGLWVADTRDRWPQPGGDRAGLCAGGRTVRRPDDDRRPDRQGQGSSLVENKEGWHGKAMSKEQAVQAIAELGGERHLTVQVRSPDTARTARPAAQPVQVPVYRVGESVATRRAYGDALKALGAARPDVVALDGEVSNSTYAEDFARAFPDRYFEMYIAEQQMVAS